MTLLQKQTVFVYFDCLQALRNCCEEACETRKFKPIKAMRKLKSLRLFCIATSLVPIVFCGCHTYTNLSEYKDDLTRYYESGNYKRDIARAVRPATSYLERRPIRGGEQLAVVLDVDDTALSDWSFTKEMYFGYNKQAFDEWAQKGSATAIQPVLDFFGVAKNLHFKIFFISARKEHLRAATEQNLRKVGYTNWDGLIMLPENGPKQSTAAFKTEARRDLESRGFKVVANVGDQESDLTGGFSERIFKIPNPFYIVAW